MPEHQYWHMPEHQYWHWGNIPENEIKRICGYHDKRINRNSCWDVDIVYTPLGNTVLFCRNESANINEIIYFLDGSVRSLRLPNDEEFPYWRKDKQDPFYMSDPEFSLDEIEHAERLIHGQIQQDLNKD